MKLRVPARAAILLTCCAAIGPFAQAQNIRPSGQSWDLQGSVPFDVSSNTGRAERIRVVIGDGGSGPYKAALYGDPGLPTHTIYRPVDLSKFNARNPLRVVAFANGGCRNSNGEFRNFLSELASHGYIVVAIGPASFSAVGGSDDAVLQSKSTQLIDGVDWIAKEAARKDSEYFGKVGTDKVALMGQSCGGFQATDVATDPRVATIVMLNTSTSIRIPPPGAPAPTPAPAAAPKSGDDKKGSYGNQDSTKDIRTALAGLALRYSPYGGATAPSSASLDMAQGDRRRANVKVPIAYFVGGPSDIAYPSATEDFNAIDGVPLLFANRDVGHYPATYREPHGGAFAVAAVGWLDWKLKGIASASAMFVGAQCGLCRDTAWTVRSKNLQ